MAFGKYTREEILAKLKAKEQKALKRKKLPLKRVKKPKLKTISQLEKILWAECQRDIPKIVQSLINKSKRDEDNPKNGRI